MVHLPVPVKAQSTIKRKMTRSHDTISRRAVPRRPPESAEWRLAAWEETLLRTQSIREVMAKPDGRSNLCTSANCSPLGIKTTVGIGAFLNVLASGGVAAGGFLKAQEEQLI